MSGGTTPTYDEDRQNTVVDYLEWVNDASVVTLRELVTGQAIRRLAPKRGNRAYARKQKKTFQALEDNLEGVEFDHPLPGNRDTSRLTFALLITLTYDHKTHTPTQSWQNISPDLASFKVKATRVISQHQKQKIKLRSITVKEGSKTGHAAPHMLVVMDKPVRCFRHYGKDGGVTYRLEDRGVVEELKKKWPHGYIDIQAVVGKKVHKGKAAKGVMGYLFKYLSKGIEMTHSPTALYQFAYHKRFNLRAVQVSKPFKELFVVPPRLDTTKNESQQIISKKWIMESNVRVPLTDFDRYMVETRPPDRPTLAQQRVNPFRAAKPLEPWYDEWTGETHTFA